MELILQRSSGYAEIKEEAEKAKKELSSAMNANINLPFIAVARMVRITWI